MKRADADLTLIKRVTITFQPLLFQVRPAALPPAEAPIALTTRPRGGRLQIGMAEIKSESVADFIPESVADFVRNTQWFGGTANWRQDDPTGSGGLSRSCSSVKMLASFGNGAASTRSSR